MSVHAMASPPYPLHPSVVDRLDPEYVRSSTSDCAHPRWLRSDPVCSQVEFYNKYIFNQQQVHYQPVAASRTSGELHPHSASGPLILIKYRACRCLDSRSSRQAARRLDQRLHYRKDRHTGSSSSCSRLHTYLPCTISWLSKSSVLPRRRLGPWKHRYRECCLHAVLRDRTMCGDQR